MPCFSMANSTPKSYCVIVFFSLLVLPFATPVVQHQSSRSEPEVIEANNAEDNTLADRSLTASSAQGPPLWSPFWSLRSRTLSGNLQSGAIEVRPDDVGGCVQRRDTVAIITTDRSSASQQLEEPLMKSRGIHRLF